MSAGKEEKVRVGLLGCGTIGSGVYHLMEKNAAVLASAAGRRLEVSRILVKDPDERRPFPADPSLMVTDIDAMLSDDGIDVFVELMGGLEPSRTIALRVLDGGRHLVTANKELIAHHGPELVKAASRSGAQLLFEAAVGGGIPLIRPMEESLGGENIEKILGIVNGTTNYILTRMSEGGCTYVEALAGARELGYAEADPVADVEGDDAASKLAILCSIAFRVGVTSGRVFREGIQGVRPEDLENARELGYTIKLLAIASRGDEGISARVHPTMIPVTHPLASVTGNFNAVFVIGESVGELMFYGQGAGSLPTATAVLGDVVNVSRKLDGPPALSREYWLEPGRVMAVDETLTRFYMVLKVVDRPGVLARIAGVFGDNQVSLESVVQKGIADQAQIVLITHEVRERNFQAAREGLARLDVVMEIPSVIRVESS